MINWTLFKRELRANSIIMVIFLAALAMYGTVIIMMFDPELGNILDMMAQSMPEVFAAFGMLNVGVTLLDFLSNYLYGFLLVVFPLVFIIMLTNRLVARYVDRGSMAYLLAAPHKRRTVMTTQIVLILASLVVMVAFTTVMCVIMAQIMFPGALEVGRFILLNTGWLGLLVFLAGVCFVPSCLFDETKISYGVGSGLTIAFVLIQMLSQVSDQMDGLKYATPLTLFDPAAIIAGDGWAIGQCLILYAVGLVLLGVGAAVFNRRDLPL